MIINPFSDEYNKMKPKMKEIILQKQNDEIKSLSNHKKKHEKIMKNNKIILYPAMKNTF
jgi:hypothetical protein